MRTTVQDIVDHLNDRIGQNPNASTQRDIFRSIESAYRELGDAFQWSYLYQQGRISTVAPYSTGTVAYSASTLELTLTGGTWPSWAGESVVIIGDASYQAVSRTSNSVIVLDSVLSPSSNISSGTAYSLYQDSYSLPADFRAAANFQRDGFLPDLQYVEPSQWLMMQKADLSTGTPTVYTVVGYPLNPGGLCVKFSPAPDQVFNYDFLYQRRPRRLTVRAEQTGSVSVTGASSVVTGSSTAFTSSMVGSVFRLSSDSTRTPSGFSGNYPAVFESRVITYTSASSITLRDAAPASYSGSKYIISDPIDIEDGAMLNAFYRCAEKHLSTIRRLPDMKAASDDYERALVLAREADSRNFSRRAAGAYCLPHNIPTWSGDVS